MDESPRIYPREQGHANRRPGAPQDVEEGKGQASDWEPTEKDAFIRLRNASLQMSAADVWMERFVGETMIPKSIAHEWNPSDVERWFKDNSLLGATKVTPSHACVTCLI